MRAANIFVKICLTATDKMTPKMKYKTFSFFLILLLLSQVAAPIPVSANPCLLISAPSAILMDGDTNRVIFSKTPNIRRAPASTTKLLTAIVAVERMDLNAVVTIPAYIEKVPASKIHLRRRERYRVRELIRALLISSANDAAEALAYAGGGGSRQKFIGWMNDKASSLGCKKSHWVNPSGLPGKGQYSTAYDMALIMAEVQRYPFLVQTLQARTLIIKSSAGRKIYLRNHNRMLARRVIGKTGWTRLARHCFVGEFLVNNRKIVVAMLGSHSLWRDLRKLVDSQGTTSWVKSSGQTQTSSEPPCSVKTIQTALKRAGFFKGPINGKFGPMTKKALKRFQKSKHIRQTGTVGPQTLNALSKIT